MVSWTAKCGNAILQGFRAMRRFHVEQSEMDRVAAVIQAILDYRRGEDMMCERIIERLGIEREIRLRERSARARHSPDVGEGTVRLETASRRERRVR